MKQSRQFPDLIKAGLKKGDTVHSYLYGEGVVKNIGCDKRDAHPIEVKFHHGTIFFKRDGKRVDFEMIPSIHLQPWNPVAGDPFPFPKFEPIVGEVYAFWDNDDNETFGFRIGTLTEIDDSEYVLADRLAYDNCAPISEAMEIFGFKDKLNQP